MRRMMKKTQAKNSQKYKNERWFTLILGSRIRSSHSPLHAIQKRPLSRNSSQNESVVHLPMLPLSRRFRIVDMSSSSPKSSSQQISHSWLSITSRRNSQTSCSMTSQLRSRNNSIRYLVENSTGKRCSEIFILHSIHLSSQPSEQSDASQESASSAKTKQPEELYSRV